METNNNNNNNKNHLLGCDDIIGFH